MTEKLTILIPSFNSEKTIRPTFESVTWADEILVCDSFSTDRTLEIARECGARIIQHEYINSALQKNWAIPQCSHEWVLIVDTDEVLEEGLKEEIRAILTKAQVEESAFRIPRKNFIYGKWMRYGGIYPDYQIRLFKKGKALYETREVHASMKVDGPVGTLRNHFLHNGFKDIREWFLKTERYLRYETDEFEKKGKNFCLFRALAYPPAVFIKHYFFELGFLEGFRGFFLAVLESFYYFMIYAKLYERKKIEPKK